MERTRPRNAEITGIVQSLIAVIIMGVAPSKAGAAIAQTDLDAARANAFAWLIQQQAGDGRWARPTQLPAHSTAAVLLAFDAVGIRHGFPRGAGLTWIANAHPSSVEALANQIATLTRFKRMQGVDTEELIDARTFVLINNGSSAAVATKFL